MHALVSMPFNNAPLKLEKISAVVYYHPETKKFYKSTVLDPMTAFIKQDLVSRQNIVLTEYDPSYLVLQYFNQYSQINVSNIPKYLTIEHYLKFGTISTNQSGKQTIKKDNTKIMNYIEKRAIKLLNMLEKKGYYKEEQLIKIKVLPNTTTNDNNQQNNEGDNEPQIKRQLPNKIILLLKQDIPEILVDQLVVTKFKKQTMKKAIMMDTYEQIIPPKQPIKKKTPSKAKSIEIPANQPSLFGFMNKSEKKKTDAN